MSGASNTPSVPLCKCGHSAVVHEPLKTPAGDYTTHCQECYCSDYDGPEYHECSHTMRLVPVSLAQANEFVMAWHRHNGPMPGAKFSVGVSCMDGVLHGVAIVGRPVARGFDDGDTLEVCRVATDGKKNASSMLYGACQRAAFALGYRRLITYTLASESGSSLRASGWSCVGQRPARKGWSAPSRPRDNTRYESVPRQLWEMVA